MRPPPCNTVGVVQLHCLGHELIQIAANYKPNMALICLTLKHMNHRPYHRALHTACTRTAHEILYFRTLPAQFLVSRVFHTLIGRFQESKAHP